MRPPGKKDDWAETTDSQQSRTDDGENSFPSSATVISPPDINRQPQPGRAPSAPIIPIASRDPRLTKLQSLRLSSEPSPKIERHQGPKRKIPWTPITALVLAGSVCFVIGPIVKNKFSATSQEVPKPTLQLMTVTFSTQSETSLNAAGYIAAAEPLTIGSTVGGRVHSVLVTNGQAVKKGTLLVQLDDSQLKAQLSLAEAKYREATRTMTRYQELVKAEAATTIDLERARGAVAVAHAEMGVLYPALKALKIVAPTNATVIEVLTREGEVLTPSTAGASVGVIKLADLSRLEMEAEVNESDISLVRRGDRVEVSIESIPDKKLPGHVRELAIQTDKAKGTVTVKVSLPPDAKLRPGMSAKARFLGSVNPPRRILIPKSAVNSGQVWVVVDGKVHHQTVRTQPAGADVVEVLEGLRPDEQIVSAGGESMVEGKSLR